MSSVYELVKAYGLWVLFIGITLESLGIPLPGETALVSAALFAGSTHRLTIGSVLFVAATAATVGGMIGYIIGRWIGLRLLVRYGKYVGLDERRLKVGQYLFLRHGGKIVFFGRFADPCRPARRCQPYELALLRVYERPRRNLLGRPDRRGRLFVRRGDETRCLASPTPIAHRGNLSGSRCRRLFSPP
jgi:membrane protein YqaA with SNARE-associated domain